MSFILVSVTVVFWGDLNVSSSGPRDQFDTIVTAMYGSDGGTVIELQTMYGSDGVTVIDL